MSTVIDRIIVICAVLAILVIGINLFQVLQQPKSVSDRVSIIQEDAQKHYQVNATANWEDDNELFFEICDEEDRALFKKHVYDQLKKYNIEHLYSLNIRKSSEIN